MVITRPYPADFVKRVKEEYPEDFPIYQGNTNLHRALDRNDSCVSSMLDFDFSLSEFLRVIDKAIQSNNADELQQLFDSLVLRRRLFLECQDHLSQGRSAS